MIYAGRGVAQTSISAKVLRADGSVKQDLGVIAYWHKNPLKRAMWRIRQWLR
jgi:hypothetical protein